MSKVQAKQITLNGNERYYLDGDVESIKYDIEHSGFKFVRINSDKISGCYWIGDLSNIDNLKSILSSDQQSVRMVVNKPRVDQKVLIFPDQKISVDMSRTIVGSISSISTDNNLVVECSIKTENIEYPSAIGIISYGRWISIILDKDKRIVGYGNINFVS